MANPNLPWGAITQSTIIDETLGRESYYFLMNHLGACRGVEESKDENTLRYL